MALVCVAGTACDVQDNPDSPLDRSILLVTLGFARAEYNQRADTFIERTIMFALPSIPSWDAAHPILVHLPIGLLAFAPVLIVATALAGERWRRGLAAATMTVIAVGTLGLVLAVMSGEAAAKLVDGILSPAATTVLEQHEEGGEMARWIFLGLTAGYVAVLGLTAVLLRKKKKAMMLGLHTVYLLAFMGGVVALANVGHLGGRLVHEFGVHAPLTKYTGDTNWPVFVPRRYEESDD
ncbi:MAG: hypothetical protein KF757_08385 [Phycisphaeraceae bacterium]|nr:hypothetical protein [Phycisphaeraceae bacterium]MCW5762773.1 hypothetical protein [Phycisphaeraceae bacterium]